MIVNKSIHRQKLEDVCVGQALLVDKVYLLS